MFVRVEEHKDDHHTVVRCPPYNEGSHDDHTDAERLDLSTVDESPPVDVVLPG